MHVFLRFVRDYPRESLWIAVAMVVGGVVEGVSRTALVPAAVALFSRDSFDHGLSGGKPPGRFVMETLQSLGITPSLGVLLLPFAAWTVVKSGISLAVNRGVGSSMVQLAWTCARSIGGLLPEDGSISPREARSNQANNKLSTH
jgi:ATP-binding cassette subfamily C protein